jgi:uncharacterized protein
MDRLGRQGPRLLTMANRPPSPDGGLTTEPGTPETPSVSAHEPTWTFRSAIPRRAMSRPALTLFGLGVVTLLLAALVPRIQIDTDPENMLPADHQARVQNDEIKDRFFLHDIVGVAIEPRTSGERVTVDDLHRAHELVQILERMDGVVSYDILSFYTSDDIRGELGTLDVDRLLGSPPTDPEVVDRLMDRLADHPVLRGVLAGHEGVGLAIFVPIRDKSYAYSVRRDVLAYWETLGEDAGTLHVAGLPVAEETFGVEMFFQMATAAPLAFVLIGLLMLWFFRSVSLVTWSLTLAAVTVIWVMGALIGLGFTVHIMSSMIPIFLLPIGVLDSVHILSDFTDRYRPGSDRRTVMAGVFEELAVPLLFTSVTSAVGFMSLALTGIPPVRVFGVAVGLGILAAFLLTLTILPAGLMLWFSEPRQTGRAGLIARFCRVNFAMARRFRVPVLVGIGAMVGLGLYGITLIEVNDNPTRWFKESHSIRQADRFFNEGFAGSYPAYLALRKEPGAWFEPGALAELERVVERVEEHEVVGKTTHLAGLVGKIHRELNAGQVEEPLPGSAAAVQQYLFLYENSGNPEDLYRLVDPDGSEINVWLHLRSGDNQDMASVIRHTEEALQSAGLVGADEITWGGITYVNLVWQQVMVGGMGWALFTAYLVIALMLWLLFRRIQWTLLALLPLTVTMVLIYGGIGWLGKDYDMPIAVLSALSIGIAVDFAIHYIQRTRQYMEEGAGGWLQVCDRVSGEPARAIARNAVIIAVGFLPLLISPLVPYVTVGVFMFLIMAISGLATLVGMTAGMEAFHSWIPDRSGGTEE